MLVVIYISTVILTETITNNAAAIMFPIAVSAANALGVSVTPFAVAARLLHLQVTSPQSVIKRT